jgi:hypothetical protein
MTSLTFSAQADPAARMLCRDLAGMAGCLTGIGRLVPMNEDDMVDLLAARNRLYGVRDALDLGDTHELADHLRMIGKELAFFAELAADHIDRLPEDQVDEELAVTIHRLGGLVDSCAGLVQAMSAARDEDDLLGLATEDVAIDGLATERAIALG